MLIIITNQPYMPKLIINIIVITLLSFAVQASIDCKQYKNGKCIACPSRAHLYNQTCYQDIVGCQQYANGTQCIRCDSTISKLVNNTCQILGHLPFSRQSGNMLRLRSDLFRKYGSASFVQITRQQAEKNEYFKLCDNWMRYTYQQNYRISKQSIPQLSIFSYIDSDRYNNSQIHFKIIYKGQDVGLYLCIISMYYNNTSITTQLTQGRTIFLQSFVPITKVNSDSNCVDFNIYGFCLGCRQGFHLQQGVCYKNIGFCTSFYGNLCLSCSGFTVLFENRCVGICQDISDCRNVNMRQGQSIKYQYFRPNISQTLQCCNKKCGFREYLNSKGECQLVNPLCKNWDSNSGNCLSCYYGFKLVRGQCLM